MHRKGLFICNSTDRKSQDSEGPEDFPEVRGTRTGKLSLGREGRSCCLTPTHGHPAPHTAFGGLEFHLGGSVCHPGAHGGCPFHCAPVFGDCSSGFSDTSPRPEIESAERSPCGGVEGGESQHGWCLA